MSDRDTDPMDKAYAQAEALLDDAAARAARRARVLAAVADTAPRAETAPARRKAWRSAGWLAAASVAGISLFVAVQINRPPVIDRPKDAPAPAIEAPAASAPAAPPASDAPAQLAPSARPGASAPADAGAPEIVAEAARRSPSFQGAPVAVEEPGALPAPPPPPPPPPPAATAAPSMGRLVKPPAPASQPAQRSAGADEISEIVVTGARRESGASPEAMVRRLHEAAAAGQSRDVSWLLSRQVPIDAVDEAGETALMKAVEARQLSTVALLRRRGASLDLKNDDGRSVRDMAAAAGDRELNTALGLNR